MIRIHQVTSSETRTGGQLDNSSAVTNENPTVVDNGVVDVGKDEADHDITEQRVVTDEGNIR